MADTYTLKWDQVGQRYYENGVSHGVLYTMTNNAYDAGVVWNGLTSISESPDGAEPNDLYADDRKYLTLRSVETFGGTIEAYTYPDEFAECDGTAVIANGVYLGQQTRKAFGLCYRTNVGNDTSDTEDDGYKLHLVYNCTASPSDKSYESVNDSPDAITFSWEFTSTAVSLTVHSDYKDVSTIVIDSTKCDKDKLAALEKKLYGSGDDTPTLPTPDEVITMMSAA